MEVLLFSILIALVIAGCLASSLLPRPFQHSCLLITATLAALASLVGILVSNHERQLLVGQLPLWAGLSTPFSYFVLTSKTWLILLVTESLLAAICWTGLLKDKSWTTLALPLNLFHVIACTANDWRLLVLLWLVQDLVLIIQSQTSPSDSHPVDLDPEELGARLRPQASFHPFVSPILVKLVATIILFTACAFMAMVMNQTPTWSTVRNPGWNSMTSREAIGVALIGHLFLLGISARALGFPWLVLAGEATGRPREWIVLQLLIGPYSSALVSAISFSASTPPSAAGGDVAISLGAISILVSGWMAMAAPSGTTRLPFVASQVGGWIFLACGLATPETVEAAHLIWVLGLICSLLWYLYEREFFSREWIARPAWHKAAIVVCTIGLTPAANSLGLQSVLADLWSHSAMMASFETELAQQELLARDSDTESTAAAEGIDDEISAGIFPRSHFLVVLVLLGQFLLGIGLWKWSPLSERNRALPQNFDKTIPMRTLEVLTAPPTAAHAKDVRLVASSLLWFTILCGLLFLLIPSSEFRVPQKVWLQPFWWLEGALAIGLVVLGNQQRPAGLWNTDETTPADIWVRWGRTGLYVEEIAQMLFAFPVAICAAVFSSGDWCLRLGLRSAGFLSMAAYVSVLRSCQTGSASDYGWIAIVGAISFLGTWLYALSSAP